MPVSGVGLSNTWKVKGTMWFGRGIGLRILGTERFLKGRITPDRILVTLDKDFGETGNSRRDIPFGNSEVGGHFRNKARDDLCRGHYSLCRGALCQGQS